MADITQWTDDQSYGNLTGAATATPGASVSDPELGVINGYKVANFVDAQDCLVAASGSPLLDLTNDVSGITAMILVRLDALPSGTVVDAQGILTFTTGLGFASTRFGVRATTNGVQLLTRRLDSDTALETNLASSMSAGSWYIITAAANYTDGTTRLVVDTTETTGTASSTTGNTSAATSTAAMVNGFYDAGTPQVLQGNLMTVAEIRVWDAFYTTGELQAHYNEMLFTKAVLET